MILRRQTRGGVDEGVALDCQELSLLYPRELIEQLDSQTLRPGVQLAAVYLWQAVLEIAALRPDARAAAGEILRGRTGHRETVLPELDQSLQALSEGLRGGTAHPERISTAAGALELSRYGGQQLLNLRGRDTQGPVLHSSRLYSSELCQLLASGVELTEQAAITKAIYWLQMSYWAMACAELHGRQYIAAMSNQTIYLRPCPPVHADRLLLRLGANQPLRVMRSPTQAHYLPLHWSKLFWPSRADELANDLQPWTLPTRPILHRALAATAGRHLDIENCRFRFDPWIKHAGQGRYARPGAHFICPVLIWTGLGMMIGETRITTRDDLHASVELHIPILEDRPGFLTQLNLVKAEQGIQSLLEQAIR